MHEAARPESLGQHHVQLGAVDRDERGQVQPPQQAEDEREEPVDLARAPELRRDQVGPDQLQQRPRQSGDHRTGDQLPRPDRPRGEDAERADEERHVEPHVHDQVEHRDRTLGLDGAEVGVQGGREHPEREGREEQDSTGEAGEEPGPVAFGHRPHLGHRVLRRLGHAQRAPERRDEPDDQGEAVAPQGA